MCKNNKNSLTDAEALFMAQHQQCPDCKTGKLIKKLGTFLSLSVLCSNPACRSEFDLGYTINTKKGLMLLMTYRVGKANRERIEKVYGISN